MVVFTYAQEFFFLACRRKKKYEKKAEKFFFHMRYSFSTCLEDPGTIEIVNVALIRFLKVRLLIRDGISVKFSR